MTSYFTFLRENRAFLAAGALLAFGSSFRQTFFISIFAGQIMGAFALSDGQWGGLYTIGTSASAVAMLWAGALTDRFRARALLLVILPGLALACIGMALTPNGAVLVVTIFALRLFGQGMMSQLSTVSTARWFVATRGRALSIAAMGFAIGQAVLPVLFVALMGVLDWRILWVVAGVMALALLPVLMRLLRLERTPASVALSSESTGMDGRHWTRGQVLRHPLFWLAVPLLLGPPMWGTALFFQQVHLTEVKGWTLGAYVALLPLYTLTSIAATFASGWVIDRSGTARLICVYLLPFALAFVLIGQARTLWGAAVGLAIVGIGTGMQATVPAAWWAQYFGTRHLGSIKALSASIMVFGSAIGPGISGYLIDRGVSFPDQMLGIAAYFVAAAALVTLGVAQTRPALPAAA